MEPEKCALGVVASIVEEYHFNSLPDEGLDMEFRLIYEGPLPADGNANDKQLVRRKLHPQLRKLWRMDPHLRDWIPGDGRRFGSKPEEIAHDYAIGDYNFVPLITEKLGMMCSLDILFLKRGELGEVVKTGGDIDNRLKTLFDALRTPDRREECGRGLPAEDERPLYTVMTNDALIADLRIETDRLLRPTELTGRAALNNVELIIKVKTRIVDYYKGHMYPHFA